MSEKMTICTSSIPHPPPVPSSTRGSTKGFRLLDPSVNDPVETGSVYSIYKQKIDSMFESDSSGVSNTVQARIERMFTEVAKDEQVPTPNEACHGFSIDYLGSVPLQGKVTSLTGLQDPLRELYFTYKRKNRENSMSGRLEISQSGLKVMYQGERGDLEQVNPFPTIAVWSAVKFVLHKDSKHTYAFLPLITDPDNIDKQQLFKDLDENDSKYIVNQTHAPLFAVVMRKIGVHKQLECHGFACQTSEDAIVIAATLYKSLMTHMKARDKKPKNKNGLTCMSMTSSIYNEGSSNVPVRPPRKKRSTTSSVVSENEIEIRDNKPKKSTKTRRAPTVPLPGKQNEKQIKNNRHDDMDEILPYEELNDISSKDDSWGEESKKDVSSKNDGLKRSRSVRKEDGTMLKNCDNSGDILTKVTIPRSGSFLNAGGLTRYKSKVNRSGPNGQASGGSPLGFHELFNEFRLQEGLHSMDEILGVIIDSEGMSFNDLKPIYKEFLLKLAVTLTKDELYQRSKSIMRRQKKKIMRKNSNAQKNRRKIILGAKGLKRVFRKSFRVNLSKKLYGKKSKAKNLDSTKIPSLNKQESSISTSSYDTRQFRPKNSGQLPRKQSYRKRKEDIKEANMRMRRDRMSTSEDSDFFTLKRSKSKTSPSNQNRNSSSGYVSCSECSYDSDTCTCVSADKCYCSLGNRFEKKGRAKTAGKLQEPTCFCQPETQRILDMSWCGCDTDSCTDSNKCYCQNFNPKGTIFEQLKRRGFIPAQSEGLTTPPNERKLCKKLSNTRSTRSVEYVPNPPEKYYDKYKQKLIYTSDEKRLERKDERGSKRGQGKLSLEYDLFNTHLYPRALSEMPARSITHSSVRSFKSYGNQRRNSTKTLQATVPADSSTEALSVKKSAEIAALFADVKLSQTTDITHLIPRDYQYRQQPRLPSRMSDKKAIVAPYKHTGSKMIQNSLYSSRGMSGRHPSKNNLYSAKNGLYTIQSQSDSSCSENHRLSLDPNGSKGVSALENTLGYLP